ncbi:hypothetical protein ILYODFUR_033593 [Ilyodon furcidens]|uniref:Uncharacterized protein n=1 Tax=Ilyodon furcidens TaxID=33524 RepID=A0ABV0UL69_9TELE
MLCCRSAWPAHHHRIPGSPRCFLNSPGLLDRRNLEVLKRCSHKMVLDFTFLFKNNQIFSIVFHIFTSRSTLPDNELKGKDKKLFFAHSRHCKCTTTRTARDGLHSGEVQNSSLFQVDRPSFIT